MFVICFIGDGPDACFKEVGAKGSKHDHAFDVWVGSVVEFWIKRVFAIEKLHDNGREGVKLCGDGSYKDNNPEDMYKISCILGRKMIDD